MLKSTNRGYDNGRINRAPLVSSRVMRLDLGVCSGDGVMLECHHLLCFTVNRALRHSQARMVCMYRDSALGRDSSQSANRGTCFDDSDMPDRPEVDAVVII